jgi:hypothetical protein
MRIPACLAVAGLVLAVCPIAGQPARNASAEQDLRRIEAEIARLEPLDAWRNLAVSQPV